MDHEKVLVFAGEKPVVRQGVSAVDMVGKTVAGVGFTYDGPYGSEPETVLYFTDGSWHGFMHPDDDQ